MPTETYAVEGLRGEQDANRVREALRDVWGIREVAVSAGTGEVTVTYDEQAGSSNDFQAAIRSCGYEIQAQNQV